MEDSVNLCFLGVIEDDENEMILFEKFKVLWITDPEMFFIECSDDDIKDIYFWSLLAFRIFATAIKVYGETKIGEKTYNYINFPIVEISFTHETFVKKIGKEAADKIISDIEKYENFILEEHINKFRSN